MKKYLIAVFAVCLAGMLLLLALPALAAGMPLDHWPDGVVTTVYTPSNGPTIYVPDSTGFAQNNLLTVQPPAGEVIRRPVVAASMGLAGRLAVPIGPAGGHHPPGLGDGRAGSLGYPAWALK